MASSPSRKRARRSPPSPGSVAGFHLGLYMSLVRLHLLQSLRDSADEDDETRLAAVWADLAHLLEAGASDDARTAFLENTGPAALRAAREDLARYAADLPESDTCWVTGASASGVVAVWVGHIRVMLATPVAQALARVDSGDDKAAARLLACQALRASIQQSPYGRARLRPALRRLALASTPAARVSRAHLAMELGEGAYGRVYPAAVALPAPAWGAEERRVLRGKAWVIKVTKDEEDPGVLFREMMGLLALRHPHVVHGLGVGKLGGQPCLVMEDAGVTLAAFLDRAGKDRSTTCSPTHVAGMALGATVPDALADHLLAQMLSALAYLHDDMGLVHGDIKPQNVCVMPERAFLLRLVDLGSLELAHPLTDGVEEAELVTTSWYRAPEQELAQAHRAPCDVWSAGCVYAQLLAVLEGRGASYRSTVLCPGHHSQFDAAEDLHPRGDSQLRVTLRGALRVRVAADPHGSVVRAATDCAPSWMSWTRRPPRAPWPSSSAGARRGTAPWHAKLWWRFWMPRVRRGRTARTP